jgi:two-component system NarL family response regulator
MSVDPPNTAVPLRTLRVLIADDHAFFRRGLREVLDDERDMAVVAEAADGAEAVRQARALRPGGLDLVLMDIDMPSMDGITATARLVAEDPELPVVMLTVSTLDRDLFEAVRVGAVGFLSKSLSPEALVRALRRFRQDEALPMSRSMATKVLAYFQQAARTAPSAPTGAAGAVQPLAAEVTLTPREREVLEQIARGARDREVAAALIVTESTVKKHVQNILRKLHARNRAEAVARLGGRHA